MPNGTNDDPLDRQLEADVAVVQAENVRRCNSCLEYKSKDDVVTVPCNHDYCRDCLRVVLQTSIADEAFFPPRCCQQEITFDTKTSQCIAGELWRELEVKRVEFSTANRTYCHDPSCSAFIPPATCVDDVATCAVCAKTTCTTCKQSSYDGDCPDDEALRQVLEMGTQEGWKRCSQCRTMIELTIGCYHMRYVEGSPGGKLLANRRTNKATTK